MWGLGVGYFTLYRPLVAGTLVGLILGNVQRGMAFGAALNAVYLGFVSTGGSLPGDLAIAGYVGTALALASGLDVEAALATLGVPLGILGTLLWFGRMTLGSWIVHWADARAEKGDVRGVAAVNLWAGQAMLALFYAVPAFVAVYWGQRGIDRLIALIPEHLIAALSTVGGLLPAVGIGLLLRGMGRWRLLPCFLAGFLLVCYFNVSMWPIALLGILIAVFSFRRRPVQREGELPGSRASGLPRRVRLAAWWRWALFLHASYNYERLQGLGFAHAMSPIIAYLYPDQAERAAALRRHVLFFNTEPQIGALVPAVVATMEEERAAGAPISDEAIHSVKSGLMGPLAGVGDLLFQGLITPLFLSTAIGIARQGLLWGPIAYVLAISAVVLGSSYGFWELGYRLGKAAVSRVLSSGWLPGVTQAAAVVGMTVLGALAAQVIQVPVGMVRAGSVLDLTLRGMLPLLLLALVWGLLHVGVSSLGVIGLLFALGIDLSYLGGTGGMTRGNWLLPIVVSVVVCLWVGTSVKWRRKS